MVFPITMAVMLAAGLISRLPVVRDSRKLSALAGVAGACAAVVFFASPPNDLAVTWPLIVFFGTALVWKLAVDATWGSYVELRGHTYRPLLELPPREQMLMLPYSAAPNLVGIVAMPLFAWLFVGDLKDKMAAGGFSLAPAIDRLPAVSLITMLLFAGFMGFAVYVARRKNPWFVVQLKLTQATLSTGDRRARLLDAALEVEPRLDSGARPLT